MIRKCFAATLLAVCTMVVFLGGLGCVNPTAGDTSTTMLFVYDQASASVLVWDDVNTIYNLGTGGVAPTPDRTITGSLLSSRPQPLAWGGMVLNTSSDELYLVYEDGTVVRIEKARTQNGALSDTQDIDSFTLGQTSDRFTSSVFAQAAFDPSTGNLYAAETGSNSQCRIWVISSPGTLGSGLPFSPSSSSYAQSAGDTGGTGVAAASSGNVFAFFTGGTQVYNNLGTTYYTGPRLRLSTGTTFTLGTNVLVGTGPELWDGTTTPDYGTLAYDSVNNRLYVARPIASGNAVLSFYQSQVSGSNITDSPNLVLGDLATALPNLRFITHARVKDWLAGADLVSGSATTTTTGTGTLNLYLWKGPSQGGSSLPFTLPAVDGNAVQVRGLALDGSQ